MTYYCILLISPFEFIERLVITLPFVRQKIMFDKIIY